jgi:CheY-like chemotaxis protein
MSTPATRILLIDDDATILQALLAKLGADGSVEVYTLTDASAASRVAREFAPALIVCDVDMEPLDGGAVAAALKRDPRTAQIPVVFLTTLVDAAHVARNHGLVGGRRMISKQAGLPAIVARIRTEAGLG